MNLLEKVGNFISKRGDYIQEQISGKRVFSAHITNATDEAGGTGTKIIPKSMRLDLRLLQEGAHQLSGFFFGH